jgi:hypothetical protein
MRVGLANFRPCIRFHSPCAATAIAYAVSAFSFAIGTLFFFITVILFLLERERHGMLRIDEGLLDKNWRPSQKTVVETKVSLREKVAELNRKVDKLETCIAKNE